MAVIFALASAGRADPVHLLRFDIPPGSLRSAVVAVGGQASVTIGMAGSSFARPAAATLTALCGSSV